MLGKWYGEIGKKIKLWAAWMFVLGVIGAWLSAAGLFISGIAAGECMLCFYAVTVAVIGPLSAWISTWILYGFGELIDKTCENEANTRAILAHLKESSAVRVNAVSAAPSVKETKDVAVPAVSVHRWRCDACGQMTSQSPCEFCGQ